MALFYPASQALLPQLVPDALLGGLDVAATALGGTPVVQYDPTMEPQLYDGYTPAGAGFDANVTLPATFTTDLAGDAGLSIAGMIVNRRR